MTDATRRRRVLRAVSQHTSSTSFQREQTANSDKIGVCGRPRRRRALMAKASAALVPHLSPFLQDHGRPSAAERGKSLPIGKRVGKRRRRRSGEQRARQVSRGSGESSNEKKSWQGPVWRRDAMERVSLKCCETWKPVCSQFAVNQVGGKQAKCNSKAKRRATGSQRSRYEGCLYLYLCLWHGWHISAISRPRHCFAISPANQTRLEPQVAMFTKHASLCMDVS